MTEEALPPPLPEETPDEPSLEGTLPEPSAPEPSAPDDPAVLDAPDSSSPDAPTAASKPSRSRYERREQASADALRGLIRDYIAEKYPRLMERGETLPITLRVDLVPGEPGELCFVPDLRRQLSDQLAEAAAPHAVYRDGAVFDFQAGGNDEPDCRPQDPTQVFCGFDNLGRPRWQPYTQVLLDQKDPEVERLHQRGGAPVVRVRMGKELKEEQLGSYGRASKEYSLLGQLTAGWFRLPPAYAKIAGDDRLALTFQIVETRVKGDFALRLNTLAGGFLPVELQDLFQEPGLRELGRARDRVLAELSDMEGRARAAQAQRDPAAFQQVMRGVPKLLNRFKAWTENGKGRAPNPRGPTNSSEWTEDVREAGEGELFFDSARDSWVLLGARGKAHVFTATGRHITSFPITPDLIEKRIVSERWVGGKPEAGDVLGRIRGVTRVE